MNNYSLANHTIAIKTARTSITIGNGAAVESISTSFANDNMSFTMSADGEATLNKNKMLNGSIGISLIQTNPFVKLLKNLYYQQLQSQPTEAAEITIKDSDGNINAYFIGCVITKIPDYNAGNEAAGRGFTIIFAKGVEY